MIFGILINHFNNAALICAAYEGNTEIVRLLLTQDDIDINSKDIWIQKH